LIIIEDQNFLRNLPDIEDSGRRKLQIFYKQLQSLVFNFVLVLDPKQSGGSFRNGISMQKCQFLAHYYYKNVSSGAVNIGESYFDVKAKKMRHSNIR
jgi:hypothetical protein